MTFNQAQATGVMRGLGFRVRSTGEYKQALRVFQGGYNLGSWLVEDGLLGPATTAALARCEMARKAGRPTVSAHFSWSDFACTCRGFFPTCRVLLVRQELLWTLERYRARVGGPVKIESGYRCPSRNKVVGGAKNSQHTKGVAADIGYAMPYTVLANMHIAAGIGRSVHRPYMVRHIDRRDVGGNNLTGGGLIHPTIWVYP